MVVKAQKQATRCPASDATDQNSAIFALANPDKMQLSSARPPLKLGGILRNSSVYTLFQYLVGEQRFLRIIVGEYLRACPGQRILDIGCGPASILDFLPEGVEYHGFDVHEPYIKTAAKNHAGRGSFFCADIKNAAELIDGEFDTIIALGVLHHLDDMAVDNLFHLVRKHLKNNGRVITVDGCFHPEQGRFGTFMLKHDRGKHVRNRAGYKALVENFFARTRLEFRNDLLRIPYPSLIMELTEPKQL